MDSSKLGPNDPRVRYETATIRGKTYSYIIGDPAEPKRDTIFLLHGFPDMAFGWRCQIPFLVSLGFQVVAPNMVGYAGTDAPADLGAYSMKSVSDDVRALAELIVGVGGQIVLGGHDWGGAAVWRVALWHPGLVKAVFSVCTPLTPLHTRYTELAALVAEGGPLPNLRYQLQLAGPEVQQRLCGRDAVRRFLAAMFGARTAGDGLSSFSAEHGVFFDRLERVDVDAASPLLTRDELDHYVDSYLVRGEEEPLRGPLNWYRVRRLNFDDELDRAQHGGPLRLEMPALFVAASRDTAIPPSMSRGMERSFANLTRHEVDASHWVLTEVPDQLNAILEKWLADVYQEGFKPQL